MEIAILGAGGVGGYYGGALARSGEEVHFLARGENLAALRQKGLEARTPEGSFVVRVHAEEDVKRLGRADWVIVAVKTYSLASVAPAAQYLARNGALIVPLLNGVDIADRLVELGVPKENVIGGLTTISAFRVSPGIFERQGTVQRVVLGELDRDGSNDRVEPIAEAFRRSGVETQVSNDIRADLWRKFAFLAPVAAACGLARAPIGPVRTDTFGRLLLERGIREVVSVGRAHGIALEESEVERILQFCDSLPKTNKPSLLRDLEGERPTEIEDLSGAVSRIGRQVGIDTPIHDTAVGAIGVASALSSERVTVTTR